METKKKILIVEDEVPMAKALETKLTNEGFEAKSVSNGKEAMKELEAAEYDAMLLDLMMPEMDGFSVLKKVKEKGLRVSVIITSNLSQDEDIKKATELGAKDFIVKSNTPIVEIIEKIRNLVD